jgi:16S rRNA (cytosine1402-N4)-methyltransferase
LVNEYSADDLTKVLKEFGELPNARRTAAEIVKARAVKPIITTKQFCSVIEPLVPQKTASKFLAKVFQALRIEVNKEIDVLKCFLSDSTDVLKPGGRLVVISYHSLEDRLVKNLIQKGNFEGNVIQDFYGNVDTLYKSVGERVMVPSEEEIRRNPRARSAKLRIAQKL